MATHASGPFRFSVMCVYIGTAIGAGILALPFVVNRMGIVAGLLLLVFVGVMIGMTTHAYAVVISVVPGTKQFVGYVSTVLGERWRHGAGLLTIVGIGGSLVAYIVEVGRVLYAMLQPFIGGSIVVYALLFWCVSTFILLLGVGIVVRIETAIVYCFMLLLLIFMLVSMPFIRLDMASPTILSSAPVAFGVMLFAYAAYTALPEMRHMLTRHRQQAQFISTVLYAQAVVILFYLLFTATIVLVTHDATTPTAFVGLQSVVGGWIFWPASLFITLALGSSFIVNGVSLQHTVQYDLRVPRKGALAFAVLVPLCVAVIYQPSFVRVLSMSGAISVGCILIIIWLMYLRLVRTHGLPRTHHHYPIAVIAALITLFTLGLGSAIFFSL